MRRNALAVLALITAPAIAAAQGGMDDAAKGVKDGGIKLAGWQAKIDAREVTAGMKITDQLIVGMGSGIHISTGPATTYWNTAQNLKGDFTVMASFSEAKQTMDHPHPFGLVIAGKGLDTDKPEAFYCAANRNGTFIARGFSTTAARGTFQMNGPRGEANEAVNKEADVAKPVKQDISISVKGDNVTCSINGKVVGTYAKSALIGDGKLTSLEGFVGIRMAHNTDAQISNWMVMK